MRYRTAERCCYAASRRVIGKCSALSPFWTCFANIFRVSGHFSHVRSPTEHGTREGGQKVGDATFNRVEIVVARVFCNFTHPVFYTLTFPILAENFISFVRLLFRFSEKLFQHFHEGNSNFHHSNIPRVVFLHANFYRLNS